MDFENRINKISNEIVVAKDTCQHEKVCNLYNTVSYLYRTKGQWDRCIEVLNNAISYAEEHNLNEPLGLLWVSLGAILIEKGEMNEAINYLKNSIQKLETNPTKSASAYGNLGKAYLYIGRWDLAKKYIEKAIAKGESINSSSNLMSSHTTLARIESERGSFDDADGFFKQAIDFENQLVPYLGTPAGQLPDYQEQPVRDQVHICELRLAQSNHKRYQGLYDEAISYATQAIDVAKKIDYDFGINEGNLLLAKCYLARGNHNLADNYIPESEKLQSGSQKAEFLLEKAIILARDKKFSDAKDCFSQSILMYGNLGHKYDKEIAIIRKCIYLSKSIDFDTNYDYSSDIMTAFHKIREIGIVSENYELIEELQNYVRVGLEKTNNTLTELMEVNYLSAQQISEEDCRNQLQITLEEQNNLLLLIGNMRKYERISAVLIDFAPNDSQKAECNLLLNEVEYLIDICDGFFKSTRNYTTLFQNKIAEYNKKTDDKNNILLQILQSVFSGIGITEVFISILTACAITVGKKVLLFLLISCFAWSGLPIAVLFLIEKNNKRYIFCIIDILLIVVSMIWLLFLVTHVIT